MGLSVGKDMGVFFQNSALPCENRLETNKSFARVSRISAGTRSPAEIRTRSPTTSSSEESFLHFPSRSTWTVDETIFVRWSEIRFARSSWINRTKPLMSSIPRMIADVVIFRL